MTNCIQMVGQRRCCSAAVLARDDLDLTVRECDPRIDSFDAWIVPLVDDTSENIDVDVTRQFDLVGYPGDVVSDHDHTGGYRDHDRAAGLRAFVVGEDFVTASEVDRIGEKSPDPLSTSDNVIEHR